MTKEEMDLIVAEQNKSTAEILKAVAKVKSDYHELCKLKDMRITELEKENAELDCQKNRNKFCYSCVNATERCFRNEIGCPCEKYKFWKEENTELKAQIGKMKCCGNCKYSNQEGVYTIVCKVGGVDKTDYIEIEDNQVCEKWELRR